jgi:Mat/Ecp fimbriae major subunit
MKLRVLKAALAVSAVAMGANAAHAATANADALAVIQSAISVTKVADLDFATIANNSGGTVIVDAAATQTTTTPCSSGIVCSGTRAAARFNVLAVSGLAVDVSTQASSVTLTRVSGTETMSASLTTSAASITGNGSTDVPFYVGGTLTVGGSQVAGSYVGTFTAEAVYQ